MPVPCVDEGFGGMVCRFVVGCFPLVGDSGVVASFVWYFGCGFTVLGCVLFECFFCLIGVGVGVLGGGVDDELFDGWCWRVGEHFGGFGEEGCLGAESGRAVDVSVVVECGEG